MGNTRYYTKENGQSFAELTYDAWGMPESPNKLLNNDHGNYVSAVFTGHIYDTTLDIYFAEARFYDVANRTWLAVDPVKDGGNWYQYCSSNPITYYDPLGLWGMVTTTKQALLAGSEIEPALFWRQRDFFQGSWWQNEDNLKTAYEMLLKESGSRNMTIITLAEDFDYFDYFGYPNTRLYTLQALIGDKRTGVYSATTMTALQNAYISKNVDFDFDMPELTPDRLKAVWEWYGGYSEFSKKGAYLLENGLEDIIEGSLNLGIAYYATRPVETSGVGESINVEGSTVNDDAPSVDSNKKVILDELKKAPVEYKLNTKTGVLEPYKKQIQVTEEYIVMLRRDVGDFNHGDLDHWNLEVQTVRGNVKYDLHLYLDDNGNILPFTKDNIYIPKKSPFN